MNGHKISLYLFLVLFFSHVLFVCWQPLCNSSYELEIWWCGPRFLIKRNPLSYVELFRIFWSCSLYHLWYVSTFLRNFYWQYSLPFTCVEQVLEQSRGWCQKIALDQLYFFRKILTYDLSYLLINISSSVHLSFKNF